jgi:hypothetical protein
VNDVANGIFSGALILVIEEHENCSEGKKKKK